MNIGMPPISMNEKKVGLRKLKIAEKLYFSYESHLLKNETIFSDGYVLRMSK